MLYQFVRIKSIVTKFGGVAVLNLRDGGLKVTMRPRVFLSFARGTNTDALGPLFVFVFCFVLVRGALLVPFGVFAS